MFGLAFTDIDMAEVIPQADVRNKVKAASGAADDDLTAIDVGEPQPGAGVVESARSAVPVLPSVCFCGPLAEPGVRVSTHRALHGLCRQAWLAMVQVFGILLPRCRYRCVSTRPRLNSRAYDPCAGGWVRASNSAETPLASAVPTRWKISCAGRRPASASAVRPAAAASPRPNM